MKLAFFFNFNVSGWRFLNWYIKILWVQFSAVVVLTFKINITKHILFFHIENFPPYSCLFSLMILLYLFIY